MYFVRQKTRHLFKRRCLTALSENKVQKSAETGKFHFRLPLQFLPGFSGTYGTPGANG